MLAIERLDVFYGRVQALRAVGLRVAPGELVTIVGPNGAGKTTLLRAIMGVVPARGGAVVVEGKNLCGKPPETMVRHGLSLVPEGRELFGALTVRENLILGAYSLARARRRAQVGGDLERVFELFPPLRARVEQPACLLSGGEQQMVAVARALMAHPRLLLLDEPSVGLAPLVIREIFRVLQVLKAEGLSILLVEQNARAAFRIADRGYVLRPGGLMAEVSGNGSAADSAYQAYGLELSQEESSP